MLSQWPEFLFRSFTLLFILPLGTQTQKIKDKLDEQKENIETNLEKKLNFKITSWLKITYNSLKLLKKIVTSYVDLVTDSILLGSILVVVILTLNNYDKENYNWFPFQIAMILLLSIMVPLIVSSTIIAFTRPFVILNPQQWKELSASNSRRPLYIARLIIIVFSLFVPAIIIISKERAAQKLESLKHKFDKEEKTVEESVLEECDILKKFITEARQEQLQI